MEGIIILLVLFLLWMLIAPVVAMVNASSASRAAESAGQEIEALRKRIRMLEEKSRGEAEIHSDQETRS
jgi:hypothetical protein